MPSHNFLLGAIAGALVVAAPAFAAPIQPFSDRAFHAAQAKGEPILVDAHADWCPTCRAQAPTLDAISKDRSFAHLVILRLDYDHQTMEKRELGIRNQSTLIAFSGARESARATGITDPGAIRALAATALR
jgi:thiol-disulfide isomerase/thioredoxin